MVRCVKCGSEIDESVERDARAKSYGSCSNCWAEWTRYSIMVINDLRLDMSIPEHRQMLKRYERIFFGLEQIEQGMRDVSKEEERVPDKK
ncbi:MAG: Fe(2+)-trafficking protein [Candidatus Nitrosocaldus sp.]